MVYGYIYKIENLINGKIYVGQSTQIIKRRSIHFSTLRNNTHPNEYLQRSFNKYGESNFKFTVLNYATNKKTLDKLEEDYIYHYSCLDRNKGYNLKIGGVNGKLSPETRTKISLILKGENAPHYGKKFPLETRKKMSEAQKGENSYWYGKRHSKETRKKISIGHKGKGLFGFTGAFLKNKNPEKKCWLSTIRYNYNSSFLGLFEDPVSAQLIHDFVLEEIYNR